MVARVVPADNGGVDLQPVVERILRDVLSHQGVQVVMQRAEPTASGWRVIVTDNAHRVLTTEINSHRPATIRAALTQWIESQP